MESRIFKGMADVVSTLNKLKMPKMSDGLLKTLSNSSYKQEFLSLITGSELNYESQSTSRLHEICSCLSEVHIDGIKALDIGMINEVRLLDVAFGQRAKLFRSNVAAGLTAKGDERLIAINHVRQFLLQPEIKEEPIRMNTTQNENIPTHMNERVQGNSTVVQFADGRNVNRANYEQETTTVNESHEEKNDGKAEFGTCVRIYGGKFGSCFNQGKTKDDKAIITVDFCMKKGEAYDWKNKITFQFNANEMVYVYGVFSGLLKVWESSLHNSNANGGSVTKVFKLEKQPKGFFASLKQSTETSGRAVPISFENTAMLSSFFFNRIKLNCDNASDQLVAHWIKEQCNSYEPIVRRGANVSNG